jgi:hypothetical protein
LVARGDNQEIVGLSHACINHRFGEKKGQAAIRCRVGLTFRRIPSQQDMPDMLGARRSDVTLAVPTWICAIYEQQSAFVHS